MNGSRCLGKASVRSSKIEKEFVALIERVGRGGAARAVWRQNISRENALLLPEEPVESILKSNKMVDGNWRCWSSVVTGA